MSGNKKYWTVQEVGNLIEIFRLHKNLWDRRDASYKNRIQKINSYKKISTMFGTTANEIERKIKNLLSQYQRERRNYKKIMKIDPDHVFTPKWFGYSAMSFLHDRNKTRQDSEAVTEIQDSDSSDVFVEDIQNETQQPNLMDVKMEDDAESQSSSEVSTDKRLNERVDKTLLEQMQTRKAEQIKTTPRTQQIYQITPNKIFTTMPDDKNESAQLLEMVNSVYEKGDTMPKRDKYDIFGEMIAHNIRALKTEHAKFTIQHRINNLLYEAQLGYYDFPKNSRPSSCSASNYTAASGSINEETPTDLSTTAVKEESVLEIEMNGFFDGSCRASGI